MKIYRPLIKSCSPLILNTEVRYAKSFMIGVVLGAAAMSAYEMGNRAKNQVECQKEKIKKKLEKLFD